MGGGGPYRYHLISDIGAHALTSLCYIVADHANWKSALIKGDVLAISKKTAPKGR